MNRINLKVWMSVVMALIGVASVAVYLLAISKITIVALGDSTTVGRPFAMSYSASAAFDGNPRAPYTYWIAQRHGEWSVINRGVNGERSDQIRGRFASQVLPEHPKYVILLAGVNDTYSGYPVKITQENLAAMYREASTHGIIPIACTILPFDRASPEDHQKIRAINDWILQYAHTHALVLCDLNKVARDPKNPDRLRGTTDGLHPDLATYQRIGETLADLLDHLENVN